MSDMNDTRDAQCVIEWPGEWTQSAILPVDIHAEHKSPFDPVAPLRDLAGWLIGRLDRTDWSSIRYWMQNDEGDRASVAEVDNAGNETAAEALSKLDYALDSYIGEQVAKGEK
tara:strand:- start:11217 stop:11555 length:339 start_codon:yes stop_codon:yes gene_type:complete